MRAIEERIIGDGKMYAELAGSSSETKPIGTLIDGSLFLETDTGDVYVYNESGESWTKIGG